MNLDTENKTIEINGVVFTAYDVWYCLDEYDGTRYGVYCFDRIPGELIGKESGEYYTLTYRVNE